LDFVFAVETHGPYTIFVVPKKGQVNFTRTLDPLVSEAHCAYPPLTIVEGGAM